MAKALFLIDGSNLFYRNYFAPFRPLNAPCETCGASGEIVTSIGLGNINRHERCLTCNGSGFEPTKATWLFAKQLWALGRRYNPAYMAVAFDGEKGLHRKKLYPEYKAGRKAKPADMKPQLKRVKQILNALGIYVTECAGYEADDAIATLAARWPNPVYIVSGDKDLRQLCNRRNVAVIEPTSGHAVNWQNAGERWGIQTSQIHEFLTLTGDTTDNVPGVKGYGDKTAARLLKRYGKIKHILTAARAGQLTPALARELLAAYESKALRMAYDLIRLSDKVPGLPANIRQLAFAPEIEKALPIFEVLKFKPFWESNG